jgi:hypothetical protein
MRRLLLSFLVISLVNLASCDYLLVDCKVNLVNKSINSITFLISKDSIIDCKNITDLYRRNDTAYFGSTTQSIYFSSATIAPNDTISICISRSMISKKTIEYYAKNKEGKVYFYFISADNIIKSSEDILLPCELSFKRQSYTIEELKRNNWLITYPEQN